MFQKAILVALCIVVAANSVVSDDAAADSGAAGPGVRERMVRLKVQLSFPLTHFSLYVHFILAR